MTTQAAVPLRLLFTASRAITHRYPVIRALSDSAFRLREAPANKDRPIVLVHGGSVDRDGKQVGGDWVADAIWRDWANCWPGVYLLPEVHPATGHTTPLARNQHMVDLGADGCAAIAKTWESGTGHCARRARAAGIPTWDFDVDTAPRTAKATR